MGCDRLIKAIVIDKCIDCKHCEPADDGCRYEYYCTEDPEDIKGLEDVSKISCRCRLPNLKE